MDVIAKKEPLLKKGRGSKSTERIHDMTHDSQGLTQLEVEEMDKDEQAANRLYNILERLDVYDIEFILKMGVTAIEGQADAIRKAWEKTAGMPLDELREGQTKQGIKLNEVLKAWHEAVRLEDSGQERLPLDDSTDGDSDNETTDSDNVDDSLDNDVEQVD